MATMSTEKKIKGKSVTLAQKECLVDFMETNKELTKGKFSTNFTHKNAQHLWQKITLELNSMIGATKTTEKWRKTWTDMKCNAKTKSVGLKKSILKTGGGDYDQEITLAPIDEKIAVIIGKVPIFGQPHTVEPTIHFDNYEFLVDSSNNNILQPLEKSLYANVRGEELFPNDLPLQNESSSSKILETIQSSFNELAAKPVEISKDNVIDNTINYINQDKVISEEPIKLSVKKSKLDIFQKYADASLQLHYASEERNEILKSYYTAKLNLLERITIAKEKKVAIMEATVNLKKD